MLSLRRLLLEDVKAYRQMRLTALKTEPGNYGSTYEEEAVKDKLEYETYIETQCPDHVVMGAFDGDKLVGITAWFRDERSRLRHRGKITQVYVAQDYRGSGLSKRLIQVAVEDAFAVEEIELLTLEVVATNIPAIRLYEGLGFSQYGLFEKYFKSGDEYLDQKFMVLRKCEEHSGK